MKIPHGVSFDLDVGSMWRRLSFVHLNGMQERFPNIRTCFAHGGQMAQMNLGRRIQGFDGRPDLFDGKTSTAVGHPNIYFDTLVHDTDSFNLMLKDKEAIKSLWD